MPIRFRCKSCRQTLSVSRRQSGREVTCPACGSQIRVPTIEAPADAGAAVESDSVSSATPHRAEAAAPSAKDVPMVPTPTVAGDAGDETLSVRPIQTQFEDMDLTPMVDVTFLLLIFFMVTASFSVQKSIEVPVPDPDKEGATATVVVVEDILDKSLKIAIDSRNVITVDEAPVSDPAQLADTLADLSRSSQKVDAVVIPDPLAKHETVVMVIDAANAAGMQHIRLSSGSAED